MAHRGNQVTKIIFEVGCIISYYNNREAKESNNPYQHEGRITQVIEELKEMNKQSFFDFDTPLQIVKSYEDKVSIMLSRLYDINDFEDLLNEFRWLYFHIQSERWQIDNLQHEATDQQESPEKKIPTPALIQLCKHDNNKTAEQRANELCDRCRGKNLQPGKVIKIWYLIGWNIDRHTLQTNNYYRDILIENDLIPPGKYKDTILTDIRKYT